MEGGPEQSAAHCEHFDICSTDKVSQIHLDLDSDIGENPIEVSLATICPFSWDFFQLMVLKCVGSLLGKVRATAWSVDAFLSWQIKSTKVGVILWLREMINASLNKESGPSCLKGAVLNKPVLDSEGQLSLSPVLSFAL